MACVPGGPFVRGSDQGPKHSHPAAEVWVQTFYMDLYEVTYAQYQSCAKQRNCKRAGPRYTDFDHPNMPITGITWFDAVEYCEAHGRRLPTEAEFRRLHERLQPASDEPWRTIPWKIALLDAQRAAVKQNKPIFIWAMDGHPLGCT